MTQAVLIQTLLQTFFRGTSKKESLFVVHYCLFVETVRNLSHKTCRGKDFTEERQSSRTSKLERSALRRSWHVKHDTKGRQRRSPLLSCVTHQHNTDNTTKHTNTSAYNIRPLGSSGMSLSTVSTTVVFLTKHQNTSQARPPDIRQVLLHGVVQSPA